MQNCFVVGLRLPEQAVLEHEIAVEADFQQVDLLAVCNCCTGKFVNRASAPVRCWSECRCELRFGWYFVGSVGELFVVDSAAEELFGLVLGRIVAKN
jgi:hypothetical protein